MSTGKPIAYGLILALGVAFGGACGSSGDGTLGAGGDGDGGGAGGGSSSSSGGGSSGAGSSGSSSGSSSGGSSSSSSGGAHDGGTASSGGSSGSSSGTGSGSSSGGADAGGLVGQLLALTASCTAGGANAVATPTTYHSEGANPVNVPICKLNGALFWNSGMNIDCDGQTTTHCPGTGADKDCCYQPDTSFQQPDGMPLSAENTPYVVIPSNFKYSGLDTTNGGNVFAVIYQGKLQFAVFGDTGPTGIIGEASWATANGLGINPSPAVGGVDNGVTYIVFTGTGTQPADIGSPTESAQLGMTLAQQLIANN